MNSKALNWQTKATEYCEWLSIQNIAMGITMICVVSGDFNKFMFDRLITTNTPHTYNELVKYSISTDVGLNMRLHNIPTS